MEQDYFVKVISVVYDISMIIFRCGIFSGTSHLGGTLLNSTTVWFDMYIGAHIIFFKKNSDMCP